MAHNPATLALFAAALLLFTAANPSSAQLLNGLTVGGRLCCTSNGNCPAGAQGVPGVGVRLNCTIFGTTSTLAVGTTGATGAFNITVANIPSSVLGLPVLPCVVGVRLPLQTTVCPLLSTTGGVLVGTLRALGPVVTAVLGLVQSATVDAFVRVGV